MPIDLEEHDLDKFIIVGDRVLIRPKSPHDQTKSGLFLPPSVQEKENIQSGYVLKVGPGYPVPHFSGVEEPWKESEEVKYVPLQAQEGDLAVYLQKNAYEIEFHAEKYLIIPHAAILMLVRDEGLFE